MAIVIAGIGMPGSGKTTLLKPYALEKGLTYISPDELRQEISGDVRIQSDMRLVWDTAYARMEESIAKGRSVVFDATQYKPVDRKDFLEKARGYGATQVIGVYFDVSLERAKEWNQQRERIVPEHALVRMHDSLRKNPPLEGEGFDAVLSPEELRLASRA
jgi:predicted kinase